MFCLTQQKQADLTVASSLSQITSGYCPKTWEVNNQLTDTTAGNFCAGKKYSSMYSCAADCRYTSTSLNQTICHGLPDKLSYTSGMTYCSTVSRSLPALPQALLAILVSTRCQLCCSCASCVMTSCDSLSEMSSDRHGRLSQSYHLPVRCCTALHRAAQSQIAEVLCTAWSVSVW